MAVSESYKNSLLENENETTQQSSIQTTYDKYLQQLKTQKISAKNEAFVSAERSKNYVTNLLKAQGLGQTGLSQSTGLGLTNQYQKALSEANAQYSQGTLQAQYNKDISQQQQESSLLGQLQSSIESGNYSTTELDELSNQYKGQLSLENQQALELYINSAKSLYQNLTPTETQSVIEEANAQGYTASKDIAEYAKSRYGVSDDEATEIVNTITQTKVNTIENAKNIWGSELDKADKYSMNSTGTSAKILAKLFSTDRNKKGEEFIKTWITEAKNGNIPEGTVVDMNLGTGKDFYVYINGTFYDISRTQVSNKKLDTYKSPAALKKALGIE